MSNGAEIELESNITVDDLRVEIDRADAEILEAVERRTRLSREIGRRRMAEGGPRVVASREREIYERYIVLGQHGVSLASVLLGLGRGQLGRKLDTQ